MVSGIWGKKVGMTQVFSNDKVVPVTVVDVGNWFVTGIKTTEKDGYNAIQVGCLKKRYLDEKLVANWLKKLGQYFTYVREIQVDAIPESISIGHKIDFYNQFKEGDFVDVAGATRGRGFAGVVKRWGFTGARASHGAKMGKRPGSISFMRSQGRVIKGKKLPGHMGTEQRVMRNLPVVKVESDGPIILVKGSVPGHAGSLLFIRKQ